MSLQLLDTLETTLDQLLRIHAPMVWQGNGIVLGVSGGVDSMVLLEVVARWHRKQNGIGPIHVAHVNYGLRGEESDSDERFVHQVVANYGFEMHCHRVQESQIDDFKAHRGDEKGATSGNLQAWARDVRYRFFGQVLQRSQGAALLLGHHLDDQVETILQRLFRGAGLEAIRGLQQASSLSEYGLESVLRPCLRLWKQDIQQMAAEQGIAYREDSTNNTQSYARNVLRQTWIPTMDTMFPGWKNQLLDLENVSSTAMALADYVMESLVEHGELLRQAWLELPLNVQQFTLHRWLQSHGVHPTQKAILSLVTSLGSSYPGQAFEVGSGATIETTKTGYKVVVAPKLEVFRSEAWRIDRHEGVTDSLMVNPFVLQGVLNQDETVDSFHIRRAEPGDLFQPYGMKNGHQAVADFLANRGITGSSKSQAAVVVDANRELVAVCYPTDGVTQIGAIGEIAESRRIPDKRDSQAPLFRIQLSATDAWNTSLKASSQPIEVEGMTFRPMIMDHEIEKRIQALASQIRVDALDKGVTDTSPLHIITVLQGAVPFARDLSRHLHLPCVFDTIHLSSYKGGLSSTGQIEQKSSLNLAVEGQHVLVIEDIVDTGRTLEMFTHELASHQPASVQIAALCRKKEAMEVELDVDYVGFDIAPDFVLGYGMDVNELGRNLPHIYVKMA